jgi:hypothetical protein
MKLLPSQKNLLFTAIESANLSPKNFELTYSEGSLGVATYTKVIFKNSEFYFHFTESMNGQKVSCCPGFGQYAFNSASIEFASQLNLYHQWLIVLKKETKEDDKWERMKEETHNTKFNDKKNSEEKFSTKELVELKSRIKLLQNNVKLIGFTKEEVKAINDKIDHVTDLAESMNKFDWQNFFVGTIMSIIIQLSVTKENASLLWNVVKEFFKNNYLN